MALFSFLRGKGSDYSSEFKRYEKAMERNPADQGLKTQFIKFCLLNRFTWKDIQQEHITEALRMFEGIQDGDSFDLQCHYLVGKYYQEIQDYRKAYGVYLNAIKRFNQYVGKNPDLKSDNTDQAYSVALNLMSLQSNPIDPEVERCFKIIRKSFPLHLKQVELENEMGKPAPDQGRVWQLTEEIRRLKAEEDKELAAAQAEVPKPEKKEEEPSNAQPAPTKGIFSKLFSELSPSSVGLSGMPEEESPKTRAGGENGDFLKLSPLSEANPNAVFMAFHDEKWVGPFTLSQLKSEGFLRSSTWVCRPGSQQVLQAYEVPDLRPLLRP
jgi:hypothetical protein